MDPQGLTPFGLGIGLSTGEVAAAMLGSEERLEYTLVGDVVNLCQRLQDLARPAGTVLSSATWAARTDRPAGPRAVRPQLVKGRDTPVVPPAVAADQRSRQRTRTGSTDMTAP